MTIHNQEYTSSSNQEELGYNGKRFSVPGLSSEGIRIQPNERALIPEIPFESPIIQDLNSIWDTEKFQTPRTPVSLGVLSPTELQEFSKWGVPRILDMPIKFPGTDFRLPEEIAQFKDVIQRIADYELAINPDCFDEYYCYLTVDQGIIEPGNLQREAPCHVDGFQGARWNPKVKINHTYTVGDALPTVFYPQSFDFSKLDEAKHNYFFEMNRQVALNNSADVFQGKEGEILLMDAYCVHRGSEAIDLTPRTWIRLSFEVREFDRLGNAHNPLFEYDWKMVPRDIESLNLEPYDPDCDPSLRVFPWQDLDGTPHTSKGIKTQPRLRGASSSDE